MTPRIGVIRRGDSVPYGSLPKWEACVDCGEEKTGLQRHHPKCKSCAMKKPHPPHSRALGPILDKDGMKSCTKCGERKPAEAFSIASNRRDGRHTHCKACRNAKRAGAYGRYSQEQRNKIRRSQVKQKYGIAADLIQALYEKQEGCCAICGKAGLAPHGIAEGGADRKRSLHVDHDHATGEIRGLLCRSCNIALGHFKDSLRLLVKAAAYLERGE